MSIESDSVKAYLRFIPPQEALDKLELYKIPSPYKEILIACCVEQLQAFPAMDYLEENYKLHFTHRTYTRYLNKALLQFLKCHRWHNIGK